MNDGGASDRQSPNRDLRLKGRLNSPRQDTIAIDKHLAADTYGLLILAPEIALGSGWLGGDRVVGRAALRDLAQACHLSLENDTIDFDILHTASHPDADKYCNTARARELLGLEYRGHFPGE